MRAVVFVLALALSGCIGGGSTTVILDNDTLAQADGHGSSSCSDQATLEVDVARVDAGSVRVRVLDGDGAVAFDESYGVRDQGMAERGLFGAAGTWALEITGSFAGRITAVLSC